MKKLIKKIKINNDLYQDLYVKSMKLYNKEYSKRKKEIWAIIENLWRKNQIMKN